VKLAIVTAAFGMAILLTAIALRQHGSSPHGESSGAKPIPIEPTKSRREPASPLRQIPSADEPTTLGESRSRSRGRIRNVLVQFPDGVEISVRLKSIPMIGPPFPRPGHLAERYGDLVRLAEGGDGPSARTLWKWLSSCERAYADETSLNAAIGRLRTDKVLVYPNNVRPPMPLRGTANLAEVERVDLKEPFEFCRGVTPEQRSTAKQWLDIAVAAQDYSALQDWATSFGDTADGKKAWEYIWGLGYRGALSPLAIKALKGVPSGTPDYVDVYAYSLADFKLYEAAYGLSGNAGHQKVLTALENSLRGMLGNLTPEQTQQATTRARQLIADNRNCCYGMW
jgi:hypothetical protein